MTDEEIRGLIGQHRGDLEVFSKAKVLIQARMSELEDDPEAHDRFTGWAGTQAAMNVLIMCTVQLRGVVEDLYENLERGATVIKLVEKKDE